MLHRFRMAEIRRSSSRAEKGLGHIVVRPQLQAMDAVLRRVFAGQDQHRDGGEGADRLQHRKAVHPRQIHRQDHEIKCVLLPGQAEGGLAVPRLCHIIALHPGMFCDPGAHTRIPVYD